jgi:hypothetical protein
MSEIIYRAGDIVLLRNTGWFQRLYAVLTGRQLDRGQRCWKRLAAVTEGGGLAEAQIIEVRPWGFKIGPLARHEFRSAVSYRALNPLTGAEAKLKAEAIVASDQFKWRARLRLFLEAIGSELWAVRSYDPWAWLGYYLFTERLAADATAAGEFEMSVGGIHGLIFWSQGWEMVHGETVLQLQERRSK